MSRNGDSGVARIRGLITFVRGTKPDDRVRIKITKVGKGYARGQMIAYLDLKNRHFILKLTIWKLVVCELICTMLIDQISLS